VNADDTVDARWCRRRMLRRVEEILTINFRRRCVGLRGDRCVFRSDKLLIILLLPRDAINRIVC